MILEEPVTFAGGMGMDRAAHLRRETPSLLKMPEAVMLPLWGGKPLIDLRAAPTLAWLPVAADLLDQADDGPVFLGMAGETPCFTADFSSMDEFEVDEVFYRGLDDRAKFIDLRSIAPQLSPGNAGAGATAKGVLEWHARHQFCARCGARSEMDDGGWRRRCPSCGALHFPRTDPVVIMLVTRDDHVLLGRQQPWPEGVFSLLAGFMEPGETVEDAVRRETFEEAGIEIGRVGYLASQPWPFPASLMIGCQAEALSDRITLDPTELEDARWVSRALMQVVMADKHPKMKAPRLGAIARSILLDWCAGRIPPL